MKKHPAILFAALFVVGIFVYFGMGSGINFRQLSDVFFVVGVIPFAFGIASVVFQSNMFQNHYRTKIERKDRMNHHMKNHYQQLLVKIGPISRFFLETGAMLILMSLIFVFMNFLQ
ncbi:DUF3899 domain-containing protein [Enterococcus saccharolyticus]|uniref:DUF3899 domain-containing protein n=1 Tax=Enterococcus TaxID=1350 RepID=UPI001E2B35EF|nr:MULTISPECIES: DUF3899 domain-containing protein [Enterococcus]MCD5001770.1 DUF3899 domain-containing protein [Enterococcus saccharolyticus]